MAENNLQAAFQKSPQYMQQDTGQGSLKGIVVDVRDPHLEGCARVLVYNEHGDYKNLDIYTIDWASPIQGYVGSFNPPKIGDRVYVTYEAGDKASLVYYGSWKAVPMGDGTLPWNKWKGSDIPIECFHHRDLYPESSMIKRSGNGNAIWMNDLFLDKKHLAASINVMDTGGKFFKIKSFHSDLEQEYAPKDEFEEGIGQLYKGDIGEFKPVRKGYELTSELDATTGSIEFGIQKLSKRIVSGKEDYSADISEQQDTDKKTVYDSVAIAGKLCRTRLDNVVSGMMSGAMMLHAGASVFAPNFLTCPQRWDEDEEEGGGVLA